MNILDNVAENSFVLILLTPDQYVSNLDDIVKSAKKSRTKICYVCLSKPYRDVVEHLTASGIDTSGFFFVDALTSHYKKPEPAKNCIFLNSPSDGVALKNAIRDVTEREKCSVVLFDTISTLLIYQESSEIVKLAHSLSSEIHCEVKKLFIVMKGEKYVDGQEDLTKDLEMFADKKLDMTKIQKR